MRTFTLTTESANVLRLVLAGLALAALLQVCRRGAEQAQTQRGRDFWSWLSLASISIIAALLLQSLVEPSS